MALGPGIASYPGLLAIESIEFTDFGGIQPARIQITYDAVAGNPAAIGDMILSYESFSLVIANCHLETSDLVEGSGGQTKSAILWDERWKWRFRTITGRYNIRLPNNFVDPAHAKSPQDLATLCFQALAVASFDVSVLSSFATARPDVDWDRKPAAEALDEICQLLGCRIVCKRSTGTWTIVVSGQGGPIPDFPVDSFGDSLKSRIIPDYIKIVTAPIQFQFPVTLEPIGKDTDMSWQTLHNLSFCPSPGTPANAYGFGVDPTFQGLSFVRVLQPDGTRISPVELANQYIFRTWRMQPQVLFPWQVTIYDSGTTVNVNPQNIDRKQIMLSDQLAQIYVDSFGAEHGRPAFAFGQFWNRLNNNLPFPTRVDYQGQVFREEPDSNGSVSLAIHPIDSDRTILTFSQQMMFYVSTPTGAYFDSAHQMNYLCAAQVRDPDTWQPYRNEFLLRTGSGGTDKKNCLVVMKEDIRPWFVAVGTGARNFTDNSQEVNDQCRAYANAILTTLQQINAKTAHPVGWFPCDLDGAISMVTYSSNKSGSSMTVSLNTEHHRYIPSDEERRQMDGRRNTAAKLELLKYISDRQAKAQGTWNT